MAADRNTQYHFLPEETISEVDPSGSVASPDGFSECKQHAAPSHSARTCSAVSSVLSMLDDWWFWEVLGLSISGVILIAIVCILGYYDDQPQPTWSLMSLNTLVLWLSTVARALVLIPISRGMSQSKWLWFMKEEQVIEDLKTFDAASRGLAGSFVFLLGRPGRHFAGLAALATILALGFSPFLQNLIHYVPHSVADAAFPAYVTNASDYDSNGIPMGGQTMTYWIDPVMKANVYNSLLNTDASQAWTRPQFDCRSGNCTWNAIATLAVRPSCASFSPLLREKCWDTSGMCELQEIETGFNLWWSKHPSGPDYLLNLTTSRVSIVHETGHLPAVRMLMAKRSLKNLTALENGDGITNSSTILATECTFEICVQSLQPSVDNGFYTERITDWWCNSSLLNIPKDWKTLRPDSPAGWRRLELNPPWNIDQGMTPGNTFGIASSSLDSLSRFISGIFSGYVSVSSFGLVFSTKHSNYAAWDVLGSIFYGAMSGCAEDDDYLECAANNTAKAITKTFRDSVIVGNETANPQMAVGKTLTMVNYVETQWIWLSLPVTIWFLALVTYIGTAWMTRKTKLPSWREDILPLLFLYREEESQQMASGPDVANGKMSEHLADLADKTKVRLGVSDDRWRLT